MSSRPTPKCRRRPTRPRGLPADAAGAVAERYEHLDYGQPADPATGDANDGFTSALGNPYLFTGRQFDSESGWYEYRTRYLDPVAGRFTSRDTIGIWGDRANTGNGLGYVGNMPLSRLDPLGKGINCDGGGTWGHSASGVGTVDHCWQAEFGSVAVEICFQWVHTTPAFSCKWSSSYEQVSCGGAAVVNSGGGGGGSYGGWEDFHFLTAPSSGGGGITGGEDMWFAIGSGGGGIFGGVDLRPSFNPGSGGGGAGDSGVPAALTIQECLRACDHDPSMTTSLCNTACGLSAY